MTLKRARTSRLADFCGRWSARELIIIGVFAATAKVSTVLIAMVGGGMNPLSLLLKNNLPGAVYWGVGCFDLLCKFGSLGISFLMMRESPAMMAAVVPIVIIGYIGSLIGLWTGSKSIKELRHAGLIRS